MSPHPENAAEPEWYRSSVLIFIFHRLNRFGDARWLVNCGVESRESPLTPFARQAFEKARQLRCPELGGGCERSERRARRDGRPRRRRSVGVRDRREPEGTETTGGSGAVGCDSRRGACSVSLAATADVAPPSLALRRLPSCSLRLRSLRSLPSHLQVPARFAARAFSIERWAR